MTSFTKRCLFAVIFFVAFGLGCQTTEAPHAKASPSQAYDAGDRMVVRSSSQVVTVDSVDEAAAAISALVAEAGGFVERSSESNEATAWLQCRVPSSRLDEVMDAVAGVGKEDSRTLSAEDVTEQYADLDTRLRNDTALRDRLQQLLARADDVEDVLAIEKELNRVQSEIEIMQARFDRLKSEIELSALRVELKQKRVLGPFGYVGYGLWWAVSKLFVIR